MSSLKDAETGERGFLLTGADSFLEPYTAAVAALPGELAAARRSISNSVQQQRLDTLEELTERKMEETAQSIDLKRSGKAAPGMDLQRAERGRRLVDQIRALAAEMGETERKQLELRSKEWEDAITLSAAVTWGGSALLLFLVIAAAAMSSRDFREQRVVQ